MDRSELERLSRASVDDFNRGDGEAICAGTAPSYLYEETGTGLRCEGADELVAIIEGLRQAIPTSPVRSSGCWPRRTGRAGDQVAWHPER
jgi:hypothetical protein